MPTHSQTTFQSPCFKVISYYKWMKHWVKFMSNNSCVTPLLLIIKNTSITHDTQTPTVQNLTLGLTYTHTWTYSPAWRFTTTFPYCVQSESNNLSQIIFCLGCLVNMQLSNERVGRQTHHFGLQPQAFIISPYGDRKTSYLQDWVSLYTRTGNSNNLHELEVTEYHLHAFFF